MKLDLDPALVERARSLAARAGQPVVDLARSHTTAAVERAVLRLAGIAGADPDGIPWVNRLVDAVVADVGLGHGVAAPVWHAMATEGIDDLTLLAQKASAGSVRFAIPRGAALTAAKRASKRAVGAGIKRIDRNRVERELSTLRRRSERAAKDADMLKMTSPPCSATTRRAENERPSRSRSTRNTVGRAASPLRRK